MTFDTRIAVQPDIPAQLSKLFCCQNQYLLPFIMDILKILVS